MKTFKFLKTSILIILCTTISCERIDSSKETEKLMQTSRDWSAAAGSKDIERILSYWSDDAVVISAGEPDVKGKQAIREMVEGSLTDPNFNISWEPVSAEVSAGGDMGYLLERTTITMTDSTGTENVQNFNSVTIWKKQEDGSWKNVVDVMSPTENN